MINEKYGREADIKPKYVGTLKDFKTLILFPLEDYLFKTKFNDKTTEINIPALGLNITTKESNKLDLHSLFEVPNIEIDSNGCLYNYQGEEAYVSPEFFAKCFIERTMEVWMSLVKLYEPKMKNKEKNKTKIGEDDNLNNKKTVLEHIDFIDVFNKLAAIKSLNQKNTQGLIGLIPNQDDRNRIINLRKIEIAASIQNCIEKAFDEIIKEFQYDFEPEYYIYKSEEYKKLEAEHFKLFRSGPFIESMEREYFDDNRPEYDYGTDEQRNDWRKRYEAFKIKATKEAWESFNNEIPEYVYPLDDIQIRVINFLKSKIISHVYNIKNHSNPLITPLGLDETTYFMHPNDKYNLERLSYIDTEDFDAYSYDEHYIGYTDYDEEAKNGIHRLYYH